MLVQNWTKSAGDQQTPSKLREVPSSHASYVMGTQLRVPSLYWSALPSPVTYSVSGTQVQVRASLLNARFWPRHVHVVAPGVEYELSENSLQFMHWVCPTLSLKNPASHGLQSESAALPVNLLYVATGHAVGVPEPSGQKCPVGHAYVGPAMPAVTGLEPDPDATLPMTGCATCDSVLDGGMAEAVAVSTIEV